MDPIETNRLILKEFVVEDDAFVLKLLNTPTWLQFIGDRGVRTINDARDYIQNRFIKSYLEHGFGLLKIQLKETSEPIGACGLLKREGLTDADIGFALLPSYENKGFGFEAATAILDYAKKDLRLKRVVAITTRENTNSIKLIEKIGLVYEKKVKLPTSTTEYLLYSSDY